MSNLRLKDHTWDAANVYDSALGKTQEQINAEVGTSLAGKQGTLVSGENIKTVNGASILGSGNIEIPGGGTGEDGYSPVVTISNITGGHRVNITDKTHQQGQNFDVMDGAKGDAGDPAPASAVVPAVESWLEDNITQETGYVIDNSLTVTGAAADAKKLGDEIGGLKSALTAANSTDNLFDKNASGIQTGKFIDSNGSLSTSGVGSVSDYIPVIPGTVLIIRPIITYNWYCNYYNADKNRIDTVPLTNVETLSLDENVYFIRITYVTASIDDVVISYKNTATLLTKNVRELDSVKMAVDRSGIYNDIMAVGSVSGTGRRFNANKNVVTISQVGGSTSTTYRFCNIFGDENGEPQLFNSAWVDATTEALSAATYHPINFDPSKYELHLTAKWDIQYPGGKNKLHLASKYISDNDSVVITKRDISDDSTSISKIGHYNLSAICPPISANGNFALFVENTNASKPNVLTYCFDLVPIESEFRETDPVLKNNVNDYASRLFSKTNIESFMFFTDSHCVGGPNWKEAYLPTYRKMAAVYKSAPVDFCLFGGDAIVSGGSASSFSQEQAVSYLSCNDKICRTIFGDDKYFPMVGNHDLNMEGTATIATQDIVNAEFRRWGKAYYKFKGNTSTFYVLDSGAHRDGGNYNVPMDAYKWGQIDWLGKCLAEDDPDHAVIAMHIIRNNNGDKPLTQLFDNANQICEKYNEHSTITLNGITYDFTGHTGRVELFLGGHLHGDSYDIFNRGIPCVMRANLKNGNVVPTYDLVLCDWAGRAVTFFRIGNGSSKTIDLDTGEAIT